MGILRKVAQILRASAKGLPALVTPRPAAPDVPETLAHWKVDMIAGECDLAIVAKGNSAFAFDLYSRLSSRRGNLFFSPLSISTALAMTYGGAQGATAEEIAAALRFPFGQERLHPVFADLLQQIKGKSQALELSLANGLWAQRGCEFRESFMDLVRTHYGAELRELDLAAAAEACRIINEWAETETRGKIRDLIEPGMLGPLTRLVLANAIYFKGDWASPFKKEQTSDAPFTITPNRKATVPMMHQQEWFGYMETESFQALQLPYAGWDLAMVVFLPREAEGLSDFEMRLTPEQVEESLKGLHPLYLPVFLPRFRVTSAFTLNDVLREMGLRLAFNPSGADFSGLTGRGGLFISSVIHKAYVSVDEMGTQAAAVTGELKLMGIAPVFRADHPFLFLIRDRRSGSILFLGRVTNPKE